MVCQYLGNYVKNSCILFHLYLERNPQTVKKITRGNLLISLSKLATII